jgi:hypothetical protein
MIPDRLGALCNRTSWCIAIKSGQVAMQNARLSLALRLAGQIRGRLIVTENRRRALALRTPAMKSPLRLAAMYFDHSARHLHFEV